MKIVTRGFRKSIALIIIAAFIFQLDIFLHPQVEVEIVKQFQRAKSCYLNSQYDDAVTRIQRVIDIINEKNIDRKDILGMCHLLLGAISEKGNQPIPAAEHYRQAREVYGITLVDGVDLDGLSLYKELVKGVLPPAKGTIESESVKKKKKFPWLLAAGAAVVVGVLVYFIFIKPSKKYQLAVTRGEGVLGSPQGSTYSYKKGTAVNYNYSPAPGYSQPVVTLDGNTVPASGTIVMNNHHILTAFSNLNVVTLVPDREVVEITGGESTTFQVKLSAQPSASVNVMIGRAGGDPDIQVITNDLVFTTANWATYQPVILQAISDADAVDDEAVIRLSAPGTAGIMSKDITAREKDEDHPTVSITEPKSGSTLNGAVLIKADIGESTRIARVAFYIDWKKESLDITVPYSYTWDTSSVPDGLHIIKVIAYDNENKSATQEIPVNVANGPIRYTLSVNKDDGIEGSPATGDANYAKGESVSYNYSLQPGHSNLVVLLDNKEVTPSGIIIMDSNHELRAFADPKLYSLTVNRKTGVLGTPESATMKYKGDETISYSYNLAEGYFDLTVKLDGVPVANPGYFPINNKDHTLVAEAKAGFETDTDQVIICEGKTQLFGVKLSAQPENPVTASVRWVNGDSDVRVYAGESLTFTPSDWNVYQYVTLGTSEDTDTEAGQAVIGIGASGLYSLNIVAKEHDTTDDPHPRIVFSGVSEGQVITADTVVIGAVITDDDGIIQKVELYIDGVLKDTGTNAIYKYEWHTTGIAKGGHKLKIIAYDMCGQPGEKEITIIVE